ncbi:MAG: HlyD family efflux transporter periplasmic adaptor subunit [Anaerolineae bacterium]|nr:HlyD family efflux transporter periplasmic adaptor subunit [Anaerolineae bacterium]
MKSNLFNLILALAAIMFLAACQRTITTPADAMTPETSTEETAEATATLPAPEGRTVIADGQLASPYPSLALGFSGGVSGEVMAIHVKPGDIVAAGDILAEMETTDLQRAVDNAQMTLNRAKIDRERAQQQWERDVADAEQSVISARRAITSTALQDSTTAIEEARTALERAKQAETDAKKTHDTPLFGEWTPDDVKQSNYDNWQRAIRERELAQMRYNDALDSRSVQGLDRESRKADLAQAERKLAALQEGLAPSYDRAIEDATGELMKAQEALQNARLVAPWPALVLSLNVAPKSQVSAGSPVVTLLSQENGLRFVTQNLSEQHVPAIHAGQRARLTLRTFPETPLEGTVEAIIPQTETQNTTDARFSVRIRLDPTDLNLLPGLTGRAEIFTEE